LVVGRSGTVNARIEARNLTIEGTVDGDIVSSESVVILETAKVSGNIFTPRISIADGAQFNGSVDMDVTSSTTRH
jgi:cytoskeletal protein CcmA (bactofilin family)